MHLPYVQLEVYCTATSVQAEIIYTNCNDICVDQFFISRRVANTRAVATIVTELVSAYRSMSATVQSIVAQHLLNKVP